MMSTGEQIDYYREIASSIRAAARVIGLAENRTSLFTLASTYEKVAAGIEKSATGQPASTARAA
jgi:hypothetical protein